MSFFRYLAICSTVGWSMMIVGTSSALAPPTSRVLILASPRLPNRVNAGLARPLVMPESLASLLFTSAIGAPVSKMSRYGPLPLTFTLTPMCPESSISTGTTTRFGSGSVFLSSARRVGTSSAARANVSRARMSDALPDLEGDLFRLLPSLDGQLDGVPGLDLAGVAEDGEDVGDVGGGATFDLG